MQTKSPQSDLGLKDHITGLYLVRYKLRKEGSDFGVAVQINANF